jgi:glycosyltransferase involved in cell wall biosynthesis
MPEVVGDAALTVDPYDVSALVRAIQAVDRDPELRARLAFEGPRRAALFSPERYDVRLRALYQRLGLQVDEAPAARQEKTSAAGAPSLAAE